jgi:serine/threonine protein kinase
MIKPEDRFWIGGGSTNFVQDEAFIMDWEQRRHYTVFGPCSLIRLQDELEDEVAIDILKRYLDDLDPKVHTIWVDAEGSLVSTSSDPKEDKEFAIYYPSLLDAPTLKGSRMIEMSKLTELERFSPGVDLVSYKDEDGITRKVVFKQTSIYQWRERRWRELNILKRISLHPGIVPLDRVVVDDTDSQHILGLVVPYIPAQTLDENRGQTFKLEWLDQLMSLVDFLNLEQGIAHQDIAPRNLICLEDAPPEDCRLYLFDFDYAGVIGLPWCVENRNDVKGVIFTLYEIITLDDSYRKVPPWEQDPDTVMNLAEWPKRRDLDAEVSVFREHLAEWVERRRNMSLPEATTPPSFPEMPKPRPTVEKIGDDGKPVYTVTSYNFRTTAQELGNYVVSWERPLKRANHDEKTVQKSFTERVPIVACMFLVVCILQSCF